MFSSFLFSFGVRGTEPAVLLRGASYRTSRAPKFSSPKLPFWILLVAKSPSSHFPLTPLCQFTTAPRGVRDRVHGSQRCGLASQRLYRNTPILKLAVVLYFMSHTTARHYLSTKKRLSRCLRSRSGQHSSIRKAGKRVFLGKGLGKNRFLKFYLSGRELLKSPGDPGGTKMNFWPADA